MVKRQIITAVRKHGKRQTITAVRKHGEKTNNYSCKKTW